MTKNGFERVLTKSTKITKTLAKQITAFCIHHPKPALAAATVLCLLLWWLGAGFEAREDIDGLLETRAGHREAYDRAEELGDLERTVLIEVKPRELFSTEGLTLLRDVTDAFLGLESVATAKSLTHSVMPVRRGLSFDWDPVVPPPPWDDNELAAIEEFCLSHPLIRNVMVSGDGSRALVSVEYTFEAIETRSPASLRTEAGEITEKFAGEDVRFQIFSIPFAEMEIRQAVSTDLLLFAGGALLLAMAVLRLAFFSWRFAVALLFAHLLYLSILPGLFQLVGYRPEPFAIAVFPLLGAIQLTLLAHIGSAFYRKPHGHRLAPHALEDAAGETVKACFFAALTTGAGFLALTVSDTESIRRLGVWAAAGVAAGFLFSFGPALSIMAIAGGSRASWERFRDNRQRAEQRWKRLAQTLASLARSRRMRILAPSAALTLLAVPGVLFLKPDARVETFLPRGSEIEAMARTADTEYGGLHFAQIDFDTGRAGGVSRREFLAYLMEIHQTAEALPEVTGVYSYAQVVAILNQAWHGGGVEAQELPRENWLLNLFTVGIDAFDLPLLGALTDEERRHAFLILRMPSISSEQYLDNVGAVTSAATERAPDGVSVETGGIVHEFMEADRQVVRSQAASAFLVLGAVAALFLVLWRSPALMFAGLAVTALPIAIILGIAGYAGLTLNAVTAMAGAIAIGIAADDAVHFITCWRDANRQLQNPQQATEEAILMKGPPVLFTSVILIGFFLFLGLSSFLPAAQLGLLAAAALALTLPAVFLVLPALLPRQGALPRDNY